MIVGDEPTHDAPRGTGPRHSVYCYPPPDSDCHARDGGGREERQRANAGDARERRADRQSADRDTSIKTYP
jgi:hypothetical protein